MTHETKQAHTPGPWQATKRENTYQIHSAEQAVAKLAICEGWEKGCGYIQPQELDANARLIAAAPDLLAAAEEVEAVIQGLKLDAALQAATDKLYAAIRKATERE